MTNEEIRAIALEVARMDELMGPKDTFAFTKDRMVDFATRFLAAITEKVEPVVLIQTDPDGNLLIHEIRRPDWQSKLDQNDRAMGWTETPVFIHPAIEPASQGESRSGAEIVDANPCVPVGAARIGYMDATAFAHELGHCKVAVYPSAEAVFDAQDCAVECGVVKVKIERIEK